MRYTGPRIRIPAAFSVFALYFLFPSRRILSKCNVELHNLSSLCSSTPSRYRFEFTKKILDHHISV